MIVISGELEVAIEAAGYFGGAPIGIIGVTGGDGGAVAGDHFADGAEVVEGVEVVGGGGTADALLALGEVALGNQVAAIAFLPGDVLLGAGDGARGVFLDNLDSRSCTIINEIAAGSAGVSDFYQFILGVDSHALVVKRSGIFPN